MLCGTLYCQDPSRNLSHYLEYYTIGNGTSGSDTCHFVIFDFGLDTQDPGYVPSGASCGAGKASYYPYILRKIIGLYVLKLESLIHKLSRRMSRIFALFVKSIHLF